MCLSRSLGTFGAVVAIVGLALGPFAQQIATYKVRSVKSDVGAVIPRALNYMGALVGNTSSSTCPGGLKVHEIRVADCFQLATCLSFL